VILAPTQQEQRVLSYHLQQQGLGLVVPPNQSPGECAKAIGRLMSGPMFKQRVTEFAQKYADFNAEDQVQRMANRCEELMGD
jgi:UDP-N-acetylglucosamine:LPS N-acetylglucosamine transferase